MNNETRRILDLLSQGKLTAEEAEQLIDALKTSPEPAAAQASAALPPAPGAAPGAGPTKPEPKWLRVVVTPIPGLVEEYTGLARKNKNVNVRIPLSLVRAGVKIGAVVPGIAGEHVNSHLRQRGIDLSKLDPEHFEDVIHALRDSVIDVTDGRHQVRVFCE